MNYPVVSFFLGILVTLFSLSIGVLFPTVVWNGEWKELTGILQGMGLGLLIGLILVAAGWKNNKLVYRREALAIVSLSWLLVTLVGAFPFYFGGMANTWSEAVFESASGLTTTGATFLTDIPNASRALLFWRSFLHFVGGLGIIVFFVAFMPFFGVGGKALYKQEVPGPVVEGLTPRITDTAVALFKAYVLLNIIMFLLYFFLGMNFFEAINHAQSTVATGGFSNRGTSMLEFSPIIQWVAIVGMFLSCTNFTLHLELLKGNFSAYWKSAEFRFFSFLILVAAVLITTILYVSGTEAVSNQGGLNFRDALFAVVSSSSTTGFATVDFNKWPASCQIILMLLIAIGGMVGSTAGGIKIMRIVVLKEMVVHELRKEISPRRVQSIYVDDRPVSKDILWGTALFMVVWIFVLVAGSTLLSLVTPELTAVECISGVITCVSAGGPGLGSIGPWGNYAHVNDIGKFVLSFCMILGRLEYYAVLVLFFPRFWVRD